MNTVFFLITLISSALADCPKTAPALPGGYACKFKMEVKANGTTIETGTYCCFKGEPVGDPMITCINSGQWSLPKCTCPGGNIPSPTLNPNIPVVTGKPNTDGFHYQESGEIWMPSKGDQTACGMSNGPYDPYYEPRYGSQCGGKITEPPTRCKGDVANQLYPLSKGEIVDRHNCWRSKVNPPAKHMPKLQWDDELAIIAERWAAQCPMGHDSFDDRALPSRWPSVGQNLCGTSYNRTFVDCVDDWAAEGAHWKYGVGSVDGRVVGHYTQLVSDRILYVGCGSSYCPTQTGYWKFVQVCNYGPGPEPGLEADKTPYAKA